MIGFKQLTFICLDLPDEIADIVKMVRKKIDPSIAWKPAVVTIAGSSGCGHLSINQDIVHANEMLAHISKNTEPFTAQFSGISNFSETIIYFFEFVNELPFIKLQNCLINSELNFNSNPYPFKPHCTINFNSKMTVTKNKEILNIKIPKEKFTISKLSLISDYTHMSSFKLSKTSSTIGNIIKDHK